MSKAKKVVEEAKEIGNPEIDLVDKGLTSLDEIPGLCKSLLKTLFCLFMEQVEPVCCELVSYFLFQQKIS